MKKILALFFLMACVSAQAQHHHHHGHWHRSGGGWVWVVPTIIGGVVGYEIAKSQPPIVVQSPPVVLPPPVQQVCSPWTEILNPDGTITRTRTCTQ